MSRRVLICLFAGALLGFPVYASDADDLTLQEILSSYVEARGGREKLDSVQSMRMQGTMRMGSGMEAPFTVEVKRPDKVRLEFTFQGMTGIQAYDGETGWFVMPFAGKTDPEKMSEEQLKQMADQADIDGPLVDYQEKGHQLELIGKEEAEGTEAYKLKLTNKNGNVDYYYLDAEYFLPIKMEGKRNMQGTEVEIEASFGDYKEVEGLMLPHSMEIRPKGAPAGQTRTVNTIVLNPELSDDRFGMPDVKTETAESEGGN